MTATGFRSAEEKSTVDPFVGRVLHERYRIERHIESGGMGAVYEATQLSVERRVALKLLHPLVEDRLDRTLRFRREARSIAGLRHRNIVSLLDYGDPRGLPRLREALARMLADQRGLACGSDDVLVTRGSQMALWLAAHAIARPGDRIAIERYGYPPAWDAHPSSAVPTYCRSRPTWRRC